MVYCRERELQAGDCLIIFTQASHNNKKNPAEGLLKNEMLNLEARGTVGAEMCSKALCFTRCGCCLIMIT